MNYMPENHSLRAHQRANPDESRQRKRARALAIGAVAILALLVGFGTLSHYQRAATADAVLEARSNAVPAVRTLVVGAELQPRTIDLPGSMAAFDSATLFARATGYISVRNADIGTKLRKGDVIAIIAAPDLDQQLAQAKAQLLQLEASVRQAQANADLGRVTNQRTSKLVAQGWSSAQQGDTDRLTFDARAAGVAVAQANVAAQQAVVNRLQQLTDFEKITAPFDGVITGRFIDVGSLVTADAASGSPMFSIARTDVLRVQIFVPQSAYFGVKDGDHATIIVPELVNRSFDGTVARNAQALNSSTRTLLTEVDVDNKNGELAAGLYCVVRLQIHRSGPVVSLPSQAVIFNKGGLGAAVVVDGKVEFRKLELEADNGGDIDVRAGLQPGDRVILSPPVNLTNGMPVKTL
ncbi:efflux RND transporter periplasmic adaptor subunit [Methylocapsa sp. D3K7]|uniref:efflux RND transporter periplasmic adaptor subunit n=1 Tax=Methylocapsa sp. D3K7 TaxID=3041435 RepID=UPI00244E8603|nr:efflux RND transporter periplasmic adaptor subunit [Methylocapsa sp. D3K7]WGJ14862.1 efflux RND transporter periplasmic adaptor subunit [Methylocapsa sp. D3K7]